MSDFTPLSSFLGGGLIGLAAVLLMLFYGRIAGLSGIVRGVLPPVSPDWKWRIAFICGAIIAPFCLVHIFRLTIAFDVAAPTPWLVIGGLLAGIGVSFSSGCTSGHGVCGLARLSRRSIAATLIFMLTTAITLFIIRHIFGGWA